MLPPNPTPAEELWTPFSPQQSCGAPEGLWHATPAGLLITPRLFLVHRVEEDPGPLLHLLRVEDGKTWGLSALFKLQLKVKALVWENMLFSGFFSYF